jgi:hypothetical protein
MQAVNVTFNAHAPAAGRCGAACGPSVTGLDSRAHGSPALLVGVRGHLRPERVHELTALVILCRSAKSAPRYQDVLAPDGAVGLGRLLPA